MGELSTIDSSGVTLILEMAGRISPEGQAAAYEALATTPGGGAAHQKRYLVGVACGAVAAGLACYLLRK